MPPHSFSHAGTSYEVSFRRMDGQWFAVLCRDSDQSSWPLPPFTDEAVGALSEHAIRAGYIGLSEWLVNEGRWPEAADLPALRPQDGEASVRIIRKVEPRLDRAAQERIGRELRAMYDEVLQQPLPDNLVALLDVHDTRAQAARLAKRIDRSPSLSKLVAGREA